MDKINLDTLRKLQSIGNVLNAAPSSWDGFDEIHAEIIDKWKRYLEGKDSFNACLKEHGFNHFV